MVRNRIRTCVFPIVVFAVTLVPSAERLLSQQPGPAVEQQLAQVRQGVGAGPFAADWDSLGAYRIPAWYRDAKFGIFIHWGVYSVPAFGNEWYPRTMYQQGSAEFKHQVETFGPQAKFGYKDFIPQFRAENFNADAWVDLFARAGARYIVPVAEHWWWYSGGMKFNSDVEDPRYGVLYRPAQPMVLAGEDDSKEPDPNHLERWLAPDAAFMDDWLARSAEIVDKYHPDFLYFDWWIGQPAFQPYLKRMAAYYYNQGAARQQGVVLTYKDHDFPENAAVLDIERGKLDAVRLLPWQTDTSVSIHSWGYVKNDEYRDAKSLIDELVDVVSKNGNLLLNVGPKADGTIPEEARAILLQMGAWLHVNGEAIYGSRPWLVFGEGPTKVTSSALDSDRQEFTADDVRYTTHNGALYAIALGWPANGELHLRSLWNGNPYLAGPVTSVRLLGSAEEIKWRQEADGLHIKLPRTQPDELAFSFRITHSKVAAGN